MFEILIAVGCLAMSVACFIAGMTCEKYAVKKNAYKKLDRYLDILIDDATQRQRR